MNLWGLVALTVILFIAGGTATLGTIEGNKATVGFILVYCWLYNATIGATGYIAMSEIGTTRLRNKTAAFSLAMQGAWGVSRAWHVLVHCTLCTSTSTAAD